MPLDNQNLTSKTSLINVLEALRNNINYNLNCVKVAIVETFDAETLTVSCRVANKRVIGLKEDGNQILQDYPIIMARVHFLGWGSVGATFPITQGMEGLLLFNDRELETWFLTGQGGNLAYDRNHSLSDAIFICGLHSLPHMIQILLDCFHLYYGDSDIQIKEQSIEHTSSTHVFNGNVSINGDLVVDGSITATGDIVAGGISLLNHVHSGVETGSGNTGKPQ